MDDKDWKNANVNGWLRAHQEEREEAKLAYYERMADSLGRYIQDQTPRNATETNISVSNIVQLVIRSGVAILVALLIWPSYEQFGIMAAILEGIPLIIATNVASSAVSVVASRMAQSITIGVVFGVILCTALIGIVEDSVTSFAPLVVSLGVLCMMSLVHSTVKESVQKTGRPSWLARGAFGALLLTYAFLIWFSLLGGWRVFQQ